MLTLWGKAFVEVRTHRQLSEYSVIVDRPNAQKFMLPSSLDFDLPPKSSSLLHFFCQGQAKDLHEDANHSNIDSSRMNVQRDLACVARFQSRLRSQNIYGQIHYWWCLWNYSFPWYTTICTTAAIQIKGTALVVILGRHGILAESPNRGS